MTRFRLLKKHKGLLLRNKSEVFWVWHVSIKNSSPIPLAAAPLTDLTKKDHPNHIKDWLSHQEKTFQTLKSRLTSSPILWLPVFNEGKPFILRSDASNFGIGAVLLQEFEGEGKLPIAYASKKLLSPEKKLLCN